MQHTMDEAFLTGLATRHIDYTGLQRETLEAEENRLVPEYVADYFVRAFRRLGGRVEHRDELFSVPDVPYELRRWSQDLDFKSAYGALQRDYRRITFDKAYARTHPEATFVAPGHPLLEAVNATVLRDMANGMGSYALFGDPEGRREGVLWFVEGTVADGTGDPAGRRVFCIHQAPDGTLRSLNPAALWDLQPLDTNALLPVGEGHRQAAGAGKGEAVEDFVITQILLPYRQEIAARREHEATVKEKYGLRSLDYLMQESNQKILDYQLRQQLGEEMDLALLQEQRNLEQLGERRAALEREIRLERNLTLDAPCILGAAVVVPLAPEETAYPESDVVLHPGQEPREGYDAKPQSAKPQSAGAVMQRDDEAEAVGMAVAMAYEREAGRHPEDVSQENLGFDIRSIGYHADGTLAGARYIEVKARAQTGACALRRTSGRKRATSATTSGFTS